MTELGTARARPGELDTGRLAVGETRDGSEVGLPVAVINGEDDGKTIYIQAVSDGDELNGLGVIQRLIPRLDPQQVSGTILVVGIANWHAFHVAEHRNPIDDTKLNRAYPGDPQGSSSERIAAATFEVARRADLVIDIHQGSTSRMIHETRIRCGRHHELHDECLKLAKIFDCGYILDQQGPEGQLAREIVEEGIPAIDPELGGNVGWDEASIEIGLQGVENVLKHYGFINGNKSVPSQTRIAGFDQYYSPVGGLVRFESDLGAEVARGDTLFTVTDVFGSDRSTVRADTSGIFWRTRRLPHVASGEYVCSVGRDVDVV